MTIAPEDYWKLRAAMADLERDHAMVVTAQHRLTQSQQRRQQVWQQIATAYGVNPDAAYTLKDEDCSLNVP